MGSLADQSSFVLRCAVGVAIRRALSRRTPRRRLRRYSMFMYTPWMARFPGWHRCAQHLEVYSV